MGKASIPIIPRRVTFDWETAYMPMNSEEEQKLMAELAEEYKNTEAEAEGDIKQGKVIPFPEKKAVGEDPENPFNMELAASGRANVDKPEHRDCTVTPDSIGLSSETPTPGE